MLTKNEIKLKLLSSNLVVDNEYLDKYVKLIEDNLTTKRKKFVTQRHHIIPRYYYKLNNLPVDNSKDNLVNLPYKYHFLTHLYLSKCSITEEFDKYQKEGFSFGTLKKGRWCHWWTS